MRLRNFVDYVQLVSLFTLIYVVLNESFSVTIVALGVVSGVVAIMLTNKLLEIDYVQIFHVDMGLVFVYFWVIIRDTYRMGFDMVIRIFTGNIEPSFVDFESVLDDEFLLTLLANAITMPPGAITVDRDGKVMTVLTVGISEDEFCLETRESIESLLVRFER